MNTLGFAISRVFEGYDPHIVCGEGEWTRKVCDVRDYLKLFDGLSKDDILTFLSFDQDGCLLAQLKAFSDGRGGDSICAWIYIPNSLRVASEQVLRAYDYVRDRIVKPTQYGDNKKQLELTGYSYDEADAANFFTTEAVNYRAEETTYVSKNKSSEGDRYAFRIIANGTLASYLGTNRYQKSYDGYRAIFLIEQSSAVRPAANYATRFSDLTNSPMEEYCLLLPPNSRDILKPDVSLFILPNGTRGDTKDEIPFNAPYPVRKGDSVYLLAHRKGFNNISLGSVSVFEEKFHYSAEDVNKKTWRVTIFPKNFKVTTESGKSDGRFKITINNYPLEASGHTFTEKECLKARVCVSTEHEEGSKTLNLLSYVDRTINIRTQRKENTMSYNICLSETQEEAELKITCKNSKNLSKEDLLNQGFTYKNHRYGALDNSGVWKQRSIGAATAIVLMVLSFTGIALYHYFFDDEEPAKTEQSANGEKGQNKESDTKAAEPSSAAIDYLDENKIWKKDELNNFTETAGLFEAMNEFRFDDIKNLEPKLKNSEDFQRLLNAIDESRSKHIDPKKGKENNHGKYNQESDNGIDKDNYINYIMRDQPPAPAPAPENSTSQQATPRTDIKAQAKEHRQKTSTPQGSKTSSNGAKGNTGKGNQRRGGAI